MRLLLVTALVFLSATASSIPDPLRSIRIASPDLSAFATFLPFGATATSFQVKDKKGRFRDILLGFDDATLYQSDAKGHPYFGPIVGRYANRIRNGTFTIPISKDASGPNKFFVPHNEGNNTLHGGLVGYDRRPWNVDKVSAHSVTFSLVDPSGTEGFPGTVKTTVVYTLERNAQWKISIKATSSALTPIMLSGHHYWNLEAYQETQDLNHHFMEFQASRWVATDGALIPTGKLSSVDKTPMDFRKAKSIGLNIPATAKDEFCGTGCVGFDNCWAFDHPNSRKPAASFWSTNSGIKLDIFTDQIALQVYTCNGIFNPDLPIPRKRSQGGPTKIYDNHSCIVIEAESLIDAINNPELDVNQIYGPARPYVWEATYAFSTL
ncbi:galactose mutarotase-like protein [Panaeolus papilionaceus]|nr:galactose mutarotase-like protein [Panaeolus papilionaceus]